MVDRRKKSKASKELAPKILVVRHPDCDRFMVDQIVSFVPRGSPYP